MFSVETLKWKKIVIDIIDYLSQIYDWYNKFWQIIRAGMIFLCRLFLPFSSSWFQVPTCYNTLIFKLCLKTNWFNKNWSICNKSKVGWKKFLKYSIDKVPPSHTHTNKKKITTTHTRLFVLLFVFIINIINAYVTSTILKFLKLFYYCVWKVLLFLDFLYKNICWKLCHLFYIPL